MIPKTSSARWLAGIRAGVVAIAIASIIVVLAIDPDGVTLDENTPEGTVQRYIQALQDEQYDVAYRLLSAEAQAECTLSNFRSQGRFGRDQDTRVRLDRVIEASDGTEVRLEMVNFSGISPFEFDFTFEDGRYTVNYLVNETDDGWRVSNAPWPYTDCGYRLRVPVPEPTATPTPAPAATPAPAEA